MFADLEVKPDDFAGRQAGRQGGQQVLPLRSHTDGQSINRQRDWPDLRSRMGAVMAHKYGTEIRGALQTMSRKDKREFKTSFKKSEDGTKGIKAGIAAFRRIAENDRYNGTWPRAERYPHFKYLANKLQ